MKAARESQLLRDLKTLATFIDVYCKHRHRGMSKTPVALKTHDIARICGRHLELCATCHKLLAHAFVKRTHCPFDPKPMCKQCPDHCYAPEYRVRIREVMKFSGRRLVLRGRLHYLRHLFF
jgi:hypothetical protein